MESKPMISFGTPSVSSNSSIPELISELRSAFRQSDFDNVEKILMDQESNMKRKYDAIEKDHGELALKNLLLEDEMEKYEQDLRKAENDRKGMILQIAELKRAKSRAEAEAETWKNKFGELELRVLRLEEDAAILMGERAAAVGTGNANMVQSQTPESVLNCVENIHSPKSPKREVDSSLEAAMAGSGRPWFRNTIEITDSDDERPVGDGTASVSNVSASCEDNGRSCRDNSLLASNLKRKRASSCNIGECGSDDEDTTPIGKRKIKHLQELGDGPRSSLVNNSFSTPDLGGCDVMPAVSPTRHNPVFIKRCDEKLEAKQNLQVLSSNSDSDDTSDSEDENDIDYFMDNMLATLQKKKENPVWAFEVDMLQAFERDDELCMNAVCALYRLQNSRKKSIKDAVSSSNQGFSHFDALRGTALANFLIGGDPQGKVRKSVSELRQNNPEVVDECRKLAIRYSRQLFEIYQKEEDPFFHP